MIDVFFTCRLGSQFKSDCFIKCWLVLNFCTTNSANYDINLYVFKQYQLFFTAMLYTLYTIAELVTSITVSPSAKPSTISIPTPDSSCNV